MRGVGIAFLVSVVLSSPRAAQASSLTRPADPVVLTSADVPALTGLPVDDVVAFRYDGGWQQIPVQIDERKVVDYGVVYDDSAIGVTTLAYADPNTYCGADTDPTFDTDDELVFMARDAGDHAGPGAGEPTGVIAGSGIELEIVDPIDAGEGVVYLFRNAGTLDPDAGQDYVSYTFDLLAGEYIPDYKTNKGPNPEDSEAFSAYYRTHFSDRWICDEIDVYAGGATGADILDRHKNLFYVGYCQRTEETFSNGEGAFFVNKDGPVRALRSYMGANSGPLTQRVHRFYERRQDVVTHLRVHAIPGIMDLYDYSPAATGMAYHNDVNLGGLTVDGVPDAATMGPIVWEMITGAQGSLLIAHLESTDIDPVSLWSHYSDNVSPTVTQCTGDDFEYALSGRWVAQEIPNTDPRSTPFNLLAAVRIVRYDEPNQTVAAAELHYDQAALPLGVTVDDYMPEASLTVSILNDSWGTIAFNPEPDDANAPTYPVGTPVTLTAEPIEGKSFTRWLIFDAAHPGDANYAVADTNAVLTLTLVENTDVEAAFKCGSGVEPFIGMALLTLAAMAVRRRS